MKVQFTVKLKYQLIYLLLCFTVQVEDAAVPKSKGPAAVRPVPGGKKATGKLL